MKVVESIKKAREKGVGDDLILKEIRRQNPEKEAFFQKAEERGATATKILDEIIKQNSPASEPSVPETSISAPPPPSGQESIFQPELQSTPPSIGEPAPGPLFDGQKSHNETTNKTLLTKEAQQEEEDMRKNFLKRIEAKERGENIDGTNFFDPSQAAPESGSSSGQEMTGGDISGSSGAPKLLIVIIIGLVVLIGFAILIISLF